jgi:hypothetical protein
MSFSRTLEKLKNGDPMGIISCILLFISLILWIGFASTKVPSGEDKIKINAIKSKRTGLAIGGGVTLVFGCALMMALHNSV